MIQDVNSAISPDQSVLNSCPTAIHCRSAASTLTRPVYESSFWASKEVYETSDNP